MKTTKKRISLFAVRRKREIFLPQCCPRRLSIDSRLFPFQITQTAPYFPSYAKSLAADRTDIAPNQDSYFIWQKADVAIAGIADGHGPEGHFVSNLARKKALEFINLKPLPSNISLFAQLIFQFISKEVEGSGLNVANSGTTLTLCFVTASSILCASVGDSPALLVREEGSMWLTQNHTMSRVDEKLRILKRGGLIYKQNNAVQERVWFGQKGQPKKFGLTITRSIGDVAARRSGVLSQPEIKEVAVKDGDVGIVLGSDGFWQQVGIKQVQRVVQRECVQKAGVELLEGGKKRRDDSTLIILQLVKR